MVLRSASALGLAQSTWDIQPPLHKPEVAKHNLDDLARLSPENVTRQISGLDVLSSILKLQWLDSGWILDNSEPDPID